MMAGCVSHGSEMAMLHQMDMLSFLLDIRELATCLGVAQHRALSISFTSSLDCVVEQRLGLG